AATTALSHRRLHVAVRMFMVVFGCDGSCSNYLNTGGRYNPTTNTWAATSTINVPTGRQLHTAVWTASEMIIWGGNNDIALNTGARYGPTPAATPCPPTPTPTITPRRTPTPRPRPTPHHGP